MLCGQVKKREKKTERVRESKCGKTLSFKGMWRFYGHESLLWQPFYGFEMFQNLKVGIIPFIPFLCSFTTPFILLNFGKMSVFWGSTSPYCLIYICLVLKFLFYIEFMATFSLVLHCSVHKLLVLFMFFWYFHLFCSNWGKKEYRIYVSIFFH